MKIRIVLSGIVVACFMGLAAIVGSAGGLVPVLRPAEIAEARRVIARGVPGGSGLLADREAVRDYYAAAQVLSRAFDPCYGGPLTRCCAEAARWRVCTSHGCADAIHLELAECRNLPAHEPDCSGQPSNPEYRKP
jgi:hypothetical protein